MKIQFLLFCVLCAVEGQNYVPVIKNGVPVDTPEVQAAKAAHFEAYERAKILAAKRPSTGKYREYKVAKNQQQQQYQQQRYYQPAHYENHVIYEEPQHHYALAAYSSEIPTEFHHPRARRSPRHYPEETPEVQAARFQHLLAHASVHEEDDEEQYPSYHDGPYHIPVITKKGVPVDTPEVREARQQHLLAHQLAKVGVRYAGGYSHYIPVIAPDGTPFDTPEVYVERVRHEVAHQEERTKQYEEEFEC
ncbi:cuticle protein 18.7-like [Tribolium madens]|uniref:cuticle protein 18.7-like n=1 Tax=Tribolium madens TaxID=41895 RepID=UPI001CF71EB8|nr:cuticle protein 18.7-like [Tribolium madens]